MITIKIEFIGNFSLLFIVKGLTWTFLCLSGLGVGTFLIIKGFIFYYDYQADSMSHFFILVTFFISGFELRIGFLSQLFSCYFYLHKDLF